MKKLFYCLIFLGFISCNGKSETSITESTDTKQDTLVDTNQELKELKTVEDIRTEYQTIQSKITNGKMDSTSFTYECDGGGGQAVYFSENGQLRKITYSSGYEHGGTIQEFFLKDNAPFFIFQDISSWAFDAEEKQDDDNLESATRDDMIERRFYIVDGKLIKCLEKEYVIRSSLKKNPSSETVQNKEVACSDLTELLKDYNLALKYKDKTGKIECLEE
jgi:hypothetical protein